MRCPYCEDELVTELDIRVHISTCAEGDENEWDTVRKLDRVLNEMLPGSQYVITVERDDRD